MPGLDRRGPAGNGPMTGGRRGLCNTEKMGYGGRFAGSRGSGRSNGYGRGPGDDFGQGRGMGMRRGFCRGNAWEVQAGSAGKTDEIAMLKEQADSMKSTLDIIIRRIADLEG